MAHSESARSSLDSGTTATTGQANELAIAGLAMTASSSTQIAGFTSPTNGFTLDLQQTQQTSTGGSPNFYEDLRYAGLYKTVSATGTQDAGASDAASHPWEGAIVTYKLSGAASTPGTGATPNTAATPVLAAQAVASYTDLWRPDAATHPWDLSRVRQTVDIAPRPKPLGPEPGDRSVGKRIPISI
jgi:hypothetical protein